jgi:hypothetical protein
VEAGGIWYCPNPLCTVTGAVWFRSKLDSYVETKDSHTVDPYEWIYKGRKTIVEGDDSDLKAMLDDSVARILKRHGVSVEVEG